MITLANIPATTKYKHLKIIKLTFCCLCIAILNGYFFSYLNEQYFHFSSNGNDLNELSYSGKLLIILIVAPLIETLFFQFFPSQVLYKLKVTKQFYLVLIPSILFSLAHCYFWLYMVMAFIGGIILNYYYIEMKKFSKYSFSLTVFLHFLYNLYGFLFVV
jgi:uncharacterized protein